MAEKADAPVDGALVKDSYYHDGARWERDIYRRLELSRNAWRLVAIGSLACLGIGLVGLALLIPLKSTEVVTLVVDKATGFTQVARPLEEGGPISQREAVTQANIVRYIRARETYDPPALRDNFELAALLSAGPAEPDEALRRQRQNSGHRRERQLPDGRLDEQSEEPCYRGRALHNNQNQ
jgi:type IV secretion system protein VirB8